MAEHVFSGERCIFCNVNTYDLYDDEDQKCEAEREALTYTTTTGDPAPMYGYSPEADDAFDQKLRNLT